MDRGGATAADPYRPDLPGAGARPPAVWSPEPSRKLLCWENSAKLKISRQKNGSRGAA